MQCYAEQYNQLRSARGTSGESSICVATLAGSFIGDKMMKVCTVCQEMKSLANFCKNHTTKDGYHYQCKVCRLKYQKIYSQTDRGKETQNRHNQTEKRKITINRHQKTGKYRITCKQYWQSEEGKATQKRFRLRHPERIKATTAVNHAVRDGELPSVKTLQCSFCPKQAKQYHHFSYVIEHWLNVFPVCLKCHKKLKIVI